jgi:hypothetical protein
MVDQRQEEILVQPMDIGRDAMANNNAATRRPTMDWPEVNSGPLMVGGILIGVGALVALAGVAVAGRHVFAATRAWVNELETPPDQVARLKWEQAKAAAAAGQAAWQKHPNAEVRLARSGNSASSRATG